jgi:hypothetical protein
MTTLNEVIEIIKAENPIIQLGDDDKGYTQLEAADYDAQILEWANARFAKLEKAAELEKAETEKATANAKLLALGLTEADLIAMGLMPKPVEPVEPA